MPQVNERAPSKAKTTSRLVSRLREISRGQVTPLGFARAEVKKLPAMLLIAEVDAADGAAVQTALGAGTDGVILRLEGGDPEAAKAALAGAVAVAGDRPVGVMLVGERAWSAEEIGALAAAGADCVVVRPSRAPAGLLKLDTLGHIALVDGDLSKMPIRGLNEQHVDAFLLRVERPEGSLPGVTVQDVAAWRSALDAFRRPVVLPALAGMAASDLEFVREVGAEAVLISVATADAATALGELRAAIDALGPPIGRGRGAEGRQVLLPRVKPAEEEDEDDEE